MITDVDKVVANLKIIKIMKSVGKKDKEIADYLGLKTTRFLEIIGSDDYLKQIYEDAQTHLASDIEKKFLENVFTQLDDGDNTDAKWVLERTTSKYQKTEKHDINIRDIDSVIRENEKAK